MADIWYYARDKKRNGPFSGRQLRDLADAGSILATDTVWKTGVELGVPAARVRHLFPTPEAGPASIAVVPSPLPPSGVFESFPNDPSLTPLAEGRQTEPATLAPEPLQEATNQQPVVRKRTAMAGKGAIVMGQDGVQVKFKKQCTTCKHMDSSSTTMKIMLGAMKALFFCTKCRKQREVELRGH